MMIPYFELLSQNNMLDEYMELFRFAVKNKPDLRERLASFIIPDQNLEWTAESRRCRYESIDAVTGSNTLSYYRIPLVLYSANRSTAIIFDMAQSRFNSFRLNFIESKEGQRMFREDYDLISNASLHLASITFSASEVLNITNYHGITFKKDISEVLGNLDLSNNAIDLLLLDFQEILNNIALEIRPKIDDDFDVLGYLNDYTSWLDLQNRFHQLARTISHNCSTNCYLAIDPCDVDEALLPKYFPINKLIIDSAKGKIIYDVLRHTFSLKNDFQEVSFTPADIVQYSTVRSYFTSVAAN